MIFEGAAVALCTPFTENGVNFRELSRLIRFQLDNGTDAVLILGTTGEPATMTDAERIQVLEAAISEIGGAVPVIAGAGSNNTAQAAAFAKKAADAGASAVLALTPYYNKCSPAGLQAHFTAIADAAGVPVIIYNVPSRTGVNMTAEQLARLLEHPGIAGIKEASGNISQVADMACVSQGRAQIYSGNDDQIVPVLSLGGSGVISVLANILPRYTHDLVRFYLDGDTTKSAEMQLKVLPLIHSLFSEVNPIPVKSALRLMGFDMGPLRLPLTPLAKEREETLKKEMEEFGLLDRERQ